MLLTEKKKRNESGEIMLESSIVIVMVLMLLLMLLGISFLYYQQALMTTVASEIAADVAKNYKFTATDINGSISADDCKELGMFRTTFGMGKLKTAQQGRADEYLTDRMDLSSFGLSPGNSSVKVTTDVIGLGRVRVKVTVTMHDVFPFSGILKALGIIESEDMHASASAECTDLMGYTSLINFADYTCNKLAPLNPIGDAYMSIKGLIDSIVG